MERTLQSRLGQLRLGGLFLAALLVTGLGSAQEDVTITYWQYDFPARIDAVDQLIEQFEAEYPNITVEQETFPYDSYQEQVAASIPAGEGADVIQLFYGWLPTWARAGYVNPLPAESFDAATLDSEFVPMVQAAKYEDEYYGLPTAVRSLALFYNADKLEEAGYSGPPATWDEFVEIAKALTEKRGPRFTQVGYGIAPNGQDHHLVREILTRQFGTPPYSEDNSEVLYGNEQGTEAFAFYTGWITNEEIGVPEFVPGANGYRDGFRIQENIAMIIDGSFAIGDTQEAAQFNWGVAELPVLEEGGTQANFGSFWMNGITPNATQDEAVLDASVKFIEFLTRPESMELWLEVVGELPARQALIENEELADDPIYGPFISSLAYATATEFVDEAAQRDIVVNAINRVALEDADPAASWQQAAEEDQALIDEFSQ